MKTTILKFAIAGVMALAFASCSTPAYVQKDDSISLSDYKTYMWVNTSAGESDQSKRASEYADISVHNAVNAELSKWGWREVNDNPDALISYDILVERSVETQRDPVYSQPFTRSYYNPYTRRWSTIFYPSQFRGYQVYEEPVREGTLTLSILDAHQDKSIWQGWTTDRISRNRLTQEEIQRSVRAIFRKQ